MKNLLILACLTLFTFEAMAALPYYEPFANATTNGGSSYAVGAKLATQTDGLGDIWNSVGGSFPGAEPMIVAGNLTYPNLTPSTGNSVSFVPAASMGDRLNFNGSITNGKAYYSYLLKLTDLTAVPTNAANNYFAGFSDGNAGQTAQIQRVGTRLLTKKVGTNYVLGVGRDNTPADYVYDTTQHSVGETVFVVGSYELVGGVTNVNVWINPSSSTFGSSNAPTPTISAVTFANTTGNINSGGVLGFIILCQNATAPSGVLDDLRIGTNWSTVTGGDPAILSFPVSQTLPAGSTATFSVTASGTAPLTYQWLKNGSPLSDGGNISGSLTATLTVSSISAADPGTYSVLITNGFGNFIQTPNVTLTLLTDPIITAQPQNVTTNFGGAATFSVTASGTLPISYQWIKNGSTALTDGGNVLGSHSSTLTLSGVSGADAGTYSVNVSNVNGQLSSSTATLTVNDPYISVQPVSTTNPAGTTASFFVTGVGTGPFTYQWFKNGNFIFDLGNLSGTSSSNLLISNISTNDQAGYSVTITGPYNTTATSTVATLTVLSPVGIAFQPSSRAVLAGAKTVFVVGATGSGPISYQWQLGGANIGGATSASYTASNVQTGVTGNYQVIISNSFSSITSSVVTLSVSNTLSLSQSNLVIIRVGDGAQTLTLNGNSFFLDQYSTSGNYVNTTTLPDSGTNSLIAIGLNNASGGNSGTATGSSLSRSLDGRFMVLAGYNTNVGYNASLKDSVYTNVPRGIATIDSSAQYNLAVADTNYSGFSQTYFRSGVTDGSNNFWGAASNPGSYYFGFGAPPALVQTNFTNPRAMGLFNGSIYCVSAVSTNGGVLKMNGMPETLDTPTVLFATGSTGSSDLEVGPNGNLIYVADDRASSAGGGIQRYQFDGANWTLSYTLTNNMSHGARYVTADFSGANPIIYAIAKEVTDDNDRLVVITDTGVNSAVTTVTYSGVNQTFRGIRFGPVPNTVVARPTLAYTQNGTGLTLSWAGAFFLQSSTNVTGPYTDVTGATSPYTNTFNPTGQLFFRLRK